LDNKLKGISHNDYAKLIMKRKNFWEICPEYGKFEMARQFYTYRIKAYVLAHYLGFVYENIKPI